MPLLFSYGSNHPDQLSERLGHDVEGQAAYAEGWKRVFRGHSRRWNGGVATMIPDEDGRTYGYVATVTARDLDTLDEYEGIRSGNYERQEIPVMTQGKRKKAIAYLSTSTTFNAPSKAYLDAVTKTVGTFWQDVSRGDFPIR